MAALVNVTTGTVSRRGNSLWLRIPQKGIDQLQLKCGEIVIIQITSGTIMIKRGKLRKKWTEAELLKGVTPDMCGPDFFAVPMGKEVL